MKVERKGGIKRVRVHHNRALFYIIIALLVVLIAVLISIKQIDNNKAKIFENQTLDGCNIDSDCVAATCCHPGACVNIYNAPECKNLMCTMECAPNTLDCGQGSCECINKKCGVVLK